MFKIPFIRYNSSFTMSTHGFSNPLKKDKYVTDTCSSTVLEMRSMSINNGENKAAFITLYKSWLKPNTKNQAFLYYSWNSTCPRAEVGSMILTHSILSCMILIKIVIFIFLRYLESFFRWLNTFLQFQQFFFR